MLSKPGHKQLFSCKLYSRKKQKKAFLYPQRRNPQRGIRHLCMTYQKCKYKWCCNRLYKLIKDVSINGVAIDYIIQTAFIEPFCYLLYLEKIYHKP